MTSIRRRLLVWLLTTVLVAGFIAGGIVFMQARKQANQLFDYQLRQLALTLRDRDFTPGELARAFRETEQADFVIQAWTPDGLLLYRSHAEIDGVGPSAGQGFSDVRNAAGAWRIFTIWHRGLAIQVAHHRLAREALALRAAWSTLLPFLIALPLIGVLIWRLVGREMKVLESTAEAVARRTPEALQPIEARALPDEVRPLVGALNGLMARLGAALAQQREFVADAAHELRTPLTALRLQLQLAERAGSEEARREAHAALRDGIARAVHVVEQLLTLARADPAAVAGQRTAVELGALANDVVRALDPAAVEKSLALSLEADGTVTVHGERAALQALMENLVGNAVRYTPSGAVRVRVRREGPTALFEVEDTGPGIPAAERTRAFDRFYRGNTDESGAGLGLSIVRRIAERHGGGAELLDGPGGRGLLARVRLPAA
jgi:signal transduction histidine kinase